MIDHGPGAPIVQLPPKETQPECPRAHRVARVVLLAAASILSSESGLAADLPAQMEPVAPVAHVPTFSWTGFYLGGELGWIRTDPAYTTAAVLLGAPFVVTSTSNKNGLSYGVMAGYNYQMGNVVLGVEGDLQGWTVGASRFTSITGDFLTAHSKWGGSIRGRLGYAADHALFYVAGGGAFASNNTTVPTTGISVDGDGARAGWTAGAGIDYAFADNWFTGLEYRYSQYQSKSFVYPTPIAGLGFVGFRHELSNNQVTARIGYKF
jgi:outer membrane immunogenic protein